MKSITLIASGKMKKIALLCVALLSVVSLFSQSAYEQRKEQIYSQKVAFITNALDLTPDDAAAFWPLYNEHHEKVEALNTTFRDYMKDFKVNFDAKTEQDARDAVAYYQDHMKQVGELDASYQNKYMKVVSAKKVLLLLKAERNFRRQLLKRMGENHHKRPRK